jgi:hypothetical protein
MPEVEKETPEVVPACETKESEITDPADQNVGKSDDSVTNTSPGRLPARASKVAIGTGQSFISTR